MEVTSAEPGLTSTMRYLGECTEKSKAARWGRMLGAVGNAGAAAGGTPEQQQQAQINVRRVQPIPPAAKCNLARGNYVGRFDSGVLEVLVTGKKNDTVRHAVTPVVVKEPTSEHSATGASLKSAPQLQPSSAPAPTLDSSQNASVAFSSEPSGADIYVDGKFVGDTPSIVQLAAGDHDIRIEAAGRKPWTRSLHVTAGAKVNLTATFSAEQ